MSYKNKTSRRSIIIIPLLPDLPLKVSILMLHWFCTAAYNMYGITCAPSHYRFVFTNCLRLLLLLKFIAVLEELSNKTLALNIFCSLAISQCIVFSQIPFFTVYTCNCAVSRTMSLNNYVFSTRTSCEASGMQCKPIGNALINNVTIVSQVDLWKASINTSRRYYLISSVKGAANQRSTPLTHVATPSLFC